MTETVWRVARGGRIVGVGLCLLAAGCGSFERQVIPPPSASNPMTAPPAGLIDPCADLTPTQRATTKGCTGH